jgi:predicted secreted protein
MPVVSAATTSQGVTIKKTAGTAIAFLNSIDGLEVKANTIDTTALDTTGGYKTFISGFKEVSDVQLSGFYSSKDHDVFMTDFNAQTSTTYDIQFPPAGGATTGTKWSFTALVVGFKTKAAVDNVISFDVTLKVVGAPTFTSAV